MEDGAHWRHEATTRQEHGWSIAVSLCFHGLCVAGWLALQSVRQPVPEPVFVWTVVMHQMAETGLLGREMRASETVPDVVSVQTMPRLAERSLIDGHILSKHFTHTSNAGVTHGLFASPSTPTEATVGSMGTVSHPQISPEILAESDSLQNNESAPDGSPETVRLQPQTDTPPQPDSGGQIGELLSADSISLNAPTSALDGHDEEERKETVPENAVGSDASKGTRIHYGWLKAAITAKIQETKRYPSLAQERRWEGKVVVRCTITAGGELKNLKVTESSGFEVLDADAVALLRKISPLTLNQPLGQQEVSLRIPISYVIR